MSAQYSIPLNNISIQVNTVIPTVNLTYAQVASLRLATPPCENEKHCQNFKVKASLPSNIQTKAKAILYNTSFLLKRETQWSSTNAPKENVLHIRRTLSLHPRRRH